MSKTAAKQPLEMMMDAYLQNLGTVCWAQEQGEQILKSYLDQGQKARAEGQKMAEKFTEQVKQNQAQMQKFIDGSVKMSLESFQRAQVQQNEIVQKQTEMMQNQIATLESQVKKMTEQFLPQK